MRSLGERLINLRTKVHFRRRHLEPRECQNTNVLPQLINLRCGPGAASLPEEVTRIHMDFSNKMYEGNMGAKKFWRECLPRLKFHNPATPMIVNRHPETAVSPLMSIYLRNSTPATTDAPFIQPMSSREGLSKAAAVSPHERIVTIDMKDKHSSQILEQLLAETRAVPYEASAQDLAEMQALERGKKRSAKDRSRVQTVRDEKRREDEMLKRARAAGGIVEETV